jgi:nucleotide-binding universal stress UspA family protein
MSLSNLLLPTDFSEVARSVYPCAANLSRRFNAAIHLVHFCSSQNWGTRSTNQRDLVGLDKMLRNEAQLPALSPANVVSCEVIPERIQTALPRIARDHRIDLALMGKHGWSGALRFIVPSFSERLVRLAGFPVLAIDPRSQNLVPPRRATVLVPFDFTPSAHSVLSAIQFVHAHFEARFMFLNVSCPPRGRMQFFQALWLASGAGEPLIQDKFEALQRTHLLGIDATLVTREGTALQEIRHEADKLRPDLIVMSTSGLLGTVTQNVVRYSDHCVLTCPAKWLSHDDAPDNGASLSQERLTSHTCQDVFPLQTTHVARYEGAE